MNNELVKMSFKQEKTKVTKDAVAVLLDCKINIPVNDLDVASALKDQCIKNYDWNGKIIDRENVNISVIGIATRKKDDVNDVEMATKIASAKAYRTAYKACRNICKTLKNYYASVAVTFIESQKKFNNLSLHQEADIYNLVSTMDNNIKTDGEK